MNYLKQHGTAVLKKGYNVIPIKNCSKAPAIDEWSEHVTTEADIKEWSKRKRGVGVACSQTPCIDIDILDADIVQQLIEWVELNLGYAPVRIGRAPKSLLVFKSEEKFTKVQSPAYMCENRVKQQLEVLSHGQQFVAFGTHPDTKKPYTWVDDYSIEDIDRSSLPELTKAKVDELFAFFDTIIPDTWELKTGKKRDAIDSEDSVLENLKPTLDVSDKDIETALKAIDPEDYSVWLNTGMALFHQFGGNGDGFNMWDEWSSAANNYDSDVMLKKWKTFEANLADTNPVTLASVLFLQNEAMAEDPDKYMLSDFPSEKVKQYINRFVFIKTGSFVMDMRLPPSKSILSMMDFNNASANRVIEIDVGKKEPKSTTLSKLWLSSKRRREVHSLGFAPGEPRLYKEDNGVWYANEFEMPEFEDTKSTGNLAIFLKHLNYLIPSEQDRLWFVDWLAFNVQFPQRRCKVTPLHISQKHGTGRGFIVETIHELLGHWNCTKTKTGPLIKASEGGFNDFLNNSLFCSIEELKEYTSPEKAFNLMDNIRDVLTEDYLEVNVKFGNKKTQRIYTNFFFMSNHEDALVLTENDRRIYTIEGPNFLQKKAYYDALYNWKESRENLSQLKGFLMRRNLKDFNFTYAPMTDYKRNTVERMQSDTEVLFAEYLASGGAGKAMTLHTLEEELLRSSGDPLETDVNERQLIKLLRGRGFTKGVLRVEGKQKRLWVLEKRKYSTEELKENYVS